MVPEKIVVHKHIIDLIQFRKTVSINLVISYKGLQCVKKARKVLHCDMVWPPNKF